MSKARQGRFSNVETAAKTMLTGKPIIVVDSTDRENEGDLVVAAQFATPEIVNFMMAQCRGMICLSMQASRLAQLGIPMLAQPPGRTTQFATAFAMPVDGRRGVTTGVSAFDRAKTIATMLDEASEPTDLVWPGHLHLLSANPQGVLGRPGHTEASIDFCRIAGLYPAAVICEIVRNDGQMARRDDLFEFADRHGLIIATIDELIEYRRQQPQLSSVVDFPATHRLAS